MFKKILKGLCFCAACGNIAHMDAKCDDAKCTGDCSQHEKKDVETPQA